MYVWVCMCVCVRENFGLLVCVYVRESLYSAFEKCVRCVYVFLYKIVSMCEFEECDTCMCMGV